MSYQKDYEQAWKDGGSDAALELLNSIFKAPENQKIKGTPTDYLSDKDDRILTAGQGFDQLIELFKPEGTIEDRVDAILNELVEARTSENDMKYRSQPFNAFEIALDLYEYGNASLCSVHIDSEQQSKAQYDLVYGFIRDNEQSGNDSDDAYTFIYDLDNSNHYKLIYQGEVLDNKILFLHIRMAQYGQYAAKIIKTLLTNEKFSNYPKILPFQFLVVPRGRNYGDLQSESTFEFHPPLSESNLSETLSGHSLEKNYLKAAVPPKELSDEEKWLYLLPFIQDDCQEVKDLVELLKNNPTLLGLTEQLADSAIDYLKLEIQGEWAPKLTIPGSASENKYLNQARHIYQAIQAPRAHLALMKDLGEAHQELTTGYIKKLFQIPLPQLPLKDFGASITAAKRYILHIVPLYGQLSEALKKAVQSEFKQAAVRIKQNDYPVLQLLLLETSLRLEFDNEIMRPGSSWEEASYDIERIPKQILSDYLKILEACIDEMPEKFNSWAEPWSFVIQRIKGLAEHGAPMQARVIQLMECYQESWDSKRLNEEFADILYKMGLEEPPEIIIQQVESDQYHNIGIYAQWVSKVPTQKLAEFLKEFTANSKGFETAKRWEDYLHSSNKGIQIFMEGILSADNKEVIFASLVTAANDGAGKLLSKLVLAVVDRLNKGYIKFDQRENCTKIILLLEALKNLNDKYLNILLCIRLLDLRFALDNQDKDVSNKLVRLLTIYPQHPMILFCQSQLTYRTDGAINAGKVTLDSIEILCRDDIVYRKAFFEYTNNSTAKFSSILPESGYALFRWSDDYLRDKSYKDGVYVKGQKELNNDPFFEALRKSISKWSEQDRSERLEEIKNEIKFDDQLRELDNAQLAKLITEDSWNISLQIIKRLIEEPQNYIDTLLQVYYWFNDEQEHRQILNALLWPIESIHKVLVLDPEFQKHLAWFITDYAFDGQEQRTREIFKILADAGLDKVNLKISDKLPTRLGINIFSSIASIVYRTGDFKFGLALLGKYIKETNNKKPQFVLLQTNKGVLEYISGDKKEAANTFDQLFSMDWGRFEYQEDPDDFMNEILGGDLDAQIASEFWQYFSLAKYNAACVYANVGREEESIEALYVAWQKNPKKYYLSKIEAESDFDPLRKLPQFIELCHQMAIKGESS